MVKNDKEKKQNYEWVWLEVQNTMSSSKRGSYKRTDARRTGFWTGSRVDWDAEDKQEVTRGTECGRMPSIEGMAHPAILRCDSGQAEHLLPSTSLHVPGHSGHQQRAEKKQQQLDTTSHLKQLKIKTDNKIMISKTLDIRHQGTVLSD